MTAVYPPRGTTPMEPAGSNVNGVNGVKPHYTGSRSVYRRPVLSPASLEVPYSRPPAEEQPPLTPLKRLLDESTRLRLFSGTSNPVSLRAPLSPHFFQTVLTPLQSSPLIAPMRGRRGSVSI